MPGSTVRNEAATARNSGANDLTYQSRPPTGLDVVGGTILPPLLPSVFVVSVGISANCFQAKKRISCTNPEGILVAGTVSNFRGGTLSCIIINEP